uniref:C-type lectin domain-containing protein n=1 Tax=Biomphalaria glabrata TaxID=6526 RepID=A0A2C9KSI9_BIOGL
MDKLISILVLLSGLPLQAHCIRLTVSPSKLLNGLTEKLEVNCTFLAGSDPSLSSLTSLSIRRWTNSTSLREAATVSSFNGVTLSDSVTAVGTIDNSGMSFLNVIWSYPNLTNQGEYECLADGLDTTGHPLSRSSNYNVTGLNPESELLVEEILKLRQTIHHLNTDFLSLKEEVSIFMSTLTHRVNASHRTMFETSAAFNGSQYSLYSIDTVVDIVQAQATCEIYGGNLVEVNNENEFHFLKTFIEDVSDAALVLIGGNQIIDVGNWVYPHSNASIDYFRWAKDYPLFTMGANCLVLWGSFEWNMTNVNCLNSFLMRYMCENVLE